MKIKPSLRSNPVSFFFCRIALTYNDTFVKGSTVSNYQPVKPPKQLSEPQLFDIHPIKHCIFLTSTTQYQNIHARKRIAGQRSACWRSAYHGEAAAERDWDGGASFIGVCVGWRNDRRSEVWSKESRRTRRRSRIVEGSMKSRSSSSISLAFFMELRLAMRFVWGASLWIAPKFSFITKTSRNWFISMRSQRKQTKHINSFITTSITRSSSPIVIEVVPRFPFSVVRWEHGDWSEKTDLMLLLLSSVMKTGQFNEYAFADIITRYKYEVELNLRFQHPGRYTVWRSGWIRTDQNAEHFGQHGAIRTRSHGMQQSEINKKKGWM